MVRFRPMVQRLCFSKMAEDSNLSSERMETWCCAEVGPSMRGGCWNDFFTYHRCCWEELDAAFLEVLNEVDMPPANEEPWRLDDACAAEWLGSADAARFLAPVPVSPCRSRQLFDWDGAAVKAAKKDVHFFAADVSSCGTRANVCSRLQDIRADPVHPGMIWVPPANASAALAIYGDHIELLPLLERPLQREDHPDRKGHTQPMPVPEAANSSCPPSGPKVPSGDSSPSLYVVTLDSVSRTTLRILLPKTYALLTGEAGAPARRGTPLPQGSPAVPASHLGFSFHRHHAVQHGGTADHLLPMFFGGFHGGSSCLKMVWKDHHLKYAVAGKECTLHNVLDELRSAGYRLALSNTMECVQWIFDGIEWDDRFPYVMRLITEEHEADYVCTGRGHYYRNVMQWNMDILEARRHEPLFLYSHFLGAHSGQGAIAPMDEALRDHLIAVMERHPSLIVVVMADHGAIGKSCDQKAPFLHIFAPASLLVRHPDIARSLEENQKRVTSAWDIFATLRHLARFASMVVANTSALGSPDSVPDFAGFGDLVQRGVLNITASPMPWYQSAHTIDLRGGGFRPQSLFQLMPAQRGCRAAGVESGHCRVRAESRFGRLFCANWSHISDVTKEQLGVPRGRGRRGRRHLRPSFTDRGRFVCELIDMALIPQALETAFVVHKASGGICVHLTHGVTEYAESDGKRIRVRFSTREGVPPRVYEAVFNPSGDVRIVELISMLQLTRYRKYEACTPKGFPAEFCVCKLPGEDVMLPAAAAMRL